MLMRASVGVDGVADLQDSVAAPARSRTSPRPSGLPTGTTTPRFDSRPACRTRLPARWYASSERCRSCSAPSLPELAVRPAHHEIRSAERLRIVDGLGLGDRSLRPADRVVGPAFRLQHRRVPRARARGLPRGLRARQPSSALRARAAQRSACGYLPSFSSIRERLSSSPASASGSPATSRRAAVYASAALRNSPARYHASPERLVRRPRSPCRRRPSSRRPASSARDIQPRGFDVRIDAVGAPARRPWRIARPAGTRRPRSNAAKGCRPPPPDRRSPPRAARRPRRAAAAAACTAALRTPRRAAASGGNASSRRVPPRRARAVVSTCAASGAALSPSSASHASMRGWNVSPNTAARRTSARSSGASASIRAIAAASAESGRPPMPPDWIAERNRSRRNCGLPPDRCATTSRTCGGSGCCSVAQLARMRSASSGASGSSSIRDTVRYVGRRESGVATGGGRRRKARAGRRSLPARYDSSSAEASSMWCAFSISMNTGSGQHRPRGSRRRPRAASCAGSFSASISTSGVGAISTPNAMRDQRQPRREVGRSGRHLVAQGARDDCLVGIVAPEIHELPQELAPHRVRRRRRIGFAGRVQRAESGRIVAQRLEQARLADAGFADDLDQPSRARARARRAPRGSIASSASRPVNGSRCERHVARARAHGASRPTTPERAAPCP